MNDGISKALLGYLEEKIIRNSIGECTIQQ